MQNVENKMMGVGCFARQPTLARVLNRMIEAYSLGDWKVAAGTGERASSGWLALRKLMSGTSEFNGLAESGGAEEKIAGFFLTFENQQVSLSVFTRQRGKRCLKYTAPLEELSRLRRSRLH